MFCLFKKKPVDNKLFYKTDVHCHILPGVDHGAQTIEESLALVRAQMDMGISRIVCTSHVTAGTFENTPATLTAAYETLKAAVAAAELPVELFVSAEYRIDEYWNAEYAAGHILPMPGNYLLLENSFQQELFELDAMIFELRLKGYRPVLAHPERYSYYARRRSRFEQLHKSVRFQLNILSLAGYFGNMARESALWLVKNGMVDMFGSDMHNLEHASVIKDYIRSREWCKKIMPAVEGHILNDRVVPLPQQRKG